jgi:hypothetical protein
MPCGRGQGHRRLRECVHSPAVSNLNSYLQPTACAPCAAPFGVTDPGNKSQTATNGPTGNVPAGSGRQSTAATPAGNNNGQAVGPRATCDIKGVWHSILFFYGALLLFLTACVNVLEPSFPLCAPAVTQRGASASRAPFLATLN